jgi:hypothetical protein
LLSVAVCAKNAAEEEEEAKRAVLLGPTSLEDMPLRAPDPMPSTSNESAKDEALEALLATRPPYSDCCIRWPSSTQDNPSFASPPTSAT